MARVNATKTRRGLQGARQHLPRGDQLSRDHRTWRDAWRRHCTL